MEMGGSLSEEEVTSDQLSERCDESCSPGADVSESDSSSDFSYRRCARFCNGEGESSMTSSSPFGSAPGTSRFSAMEFLSEIVGGCDGVVAWDQKLEKKELDLSGSLTLSLVSSFFFFFFPFLLWFLLSSSSSSFSEAVCFGGSRSGDDEGEVCEAFAWRGYVRWGKRGMHCPCCFQCHHKPRRYVIQYNGFRKLFVFDEGMNE